MPFIRKVQLRGWKTFGPKTTITLDRGFTVLTGPNGSGKTNIVDAVLFGLGELSPRRLRSESFSKLVGIGKGDSAQVVIQFDNSDHRLPVDTATVTIYREVDKNGQSVYRLNGRRSTRSRIVDVLSVAGIDPSGHNVVMQGTVTRMTEVSPHDRRTLIEGLIGISQYDAEKAEAEEKLRAAEISIQTAMGRVDEVQRRVDDLERERNQLLRYNALRDGISRLEAVRVSHEASELEEKVRALSARVQELGGKVEGLREVREKLRSQRRGIEEEWRRFNLEERGAEVMKVQIEIGDLRSRITELTTGIDAWRASLEGLGKVRENNLRQLDALKGEIAETREKIQQLSREHDRLSKEIKVHQARHEAASKKVAEIQSGLGENSEKIREMEGQLDQLYRRVVANRGDYARSRATIGVLSRRLKELDERKNTFASTLGELQKSLSDLQGVKGEQEERLEGLRRAMDRRVSQKQATASEVSEAGRIADSAREAVVEFATQRELAEKIAAEEHALRNIEELGDLGAIEGVYGRFRNLITTERGYRRAVEAAAAGWLDSVVVRDLDAAFTCAETLKRLKLGRIKIIPLRELSALKSLNPPKIEGIHGTAASFVKCSKRYEPAVAFVFGDTLTAEHGKAALEASRKGYRTVTVEGDLFEAQGGMESGYYRAPIDFSTLIPSESAVKSLDEAVRALQDHLARREGDLSTLEEEIDRARVEAARLTDAATVLAGEITRVRRNIQRTQQNIQRVERYIQRSQEQLEKEKRELEGAQRDAVQRKMEGLRRKLAGLRRKTDPSQIREAELERDGLGETVLELRRSLGGVETELATLQSNLERVLKAGSEGIRIQLRKIEQQISATEGEVKEALRQRETLEEGLSKLERSREELSQSVLMAKEEAKTFTSQIDDIDKRLRGVDADYERASGLFNQLQISLQTGQMQLDQRRQRLRELGYEEPLTVQPEQLAGVQSSLHQMQLELERLGAVNQLALDRYAEQISRYRELSLRINELEREKQAILSFMDEIEAKKRRAFMDAFNRINEGFGGYFSRLTGGGEASLKLEDPEDPFAGGVDMIVQFPSKPSILVSGASGGERSVAAVAFIFALQEFMPAAFYLLDEVDAHLDAFHAERLGGLLAEEAAKSQFIVITLKPEMVGKAERVYGVYMHDGVSHVVSTAFKEVA